MQSCRAGWGHSSAGRALAWHARGRGFEPPWLHQIPDGILIYITTGYTAVSRAETHGRQSNWRTCLPEFARHLRVETGTTAILSGRPGGFIPETAGGAGSSIFCCQGWMTRHDPLGKSTGDADQPARTSPRGRQKHRLATDAMACIKTRTDWTDASHRIESQGLWPSSGRMAPIHEAPSIRIRAVGPRRIFQIEGGLACARQARIRASRRCGPIALP